MDRLVDFVAESPRTHVLLVPSTRDAHHDPVFPQSAMLDHALPRGIMELPNPATFQVNEVVVGVSSTDFLKQVRLLDFTVSLSGGQVFVLISCVCKPNEEWKSACRCRHRSWQREPHLTGWLH